MGTLTEVERARAMGRDARKRGAMRSPGACDPFMKMLKGTKIVGEPRTFELTRAFTDGFDEGYPNQRSDPHEHEWRNLAELDGKHRNYLASYCPLCGATMID